MEISFNDLLALCALFFMLGFATPIIVMRTLVQDREDGCALNVLLLAIVAVLAALILLMIIN